jgi:hypothetical protein
MSSAEGGRGNVHAALHPPRAIAPKGKNQKEMDREYHVNCAKKEAVRVTGRRGGVRSLGARQLGGHNEEENGPSGNS